MRQRGTEVGEDQQDRNRAKERDGGRRRDWRDGVRAEDRDREGEGGREILISHLLTLNTSI